jgi:hypothetical protein
MLIPIMDRISRTTTIEIEKSNEKFFVVDGQFHKNKFCFIIFANVQAVQLLKRKMG